MQYPHKPSRGHCTRGGAGSGCSWIDASWCHLVTSGSTVLEDGQVHVLHQDRYKKQSRLPAKHGDDDTTAATFLVEFYACSKWLMCCLQLCPFSFCRAPSMDRRVQLKRSGWAPLWGWQTQVGDFQISRQERSCFMTFSSKSDGHGFLIPTWEHVCSFLCYPVQSATDLYRRDLTDQ